MRDLPDSRLETVRLEDNTLEMVFENGQVVSFRDTASYCCESRWMDCDDNLDSFRGDKAVRWELSDVKSEDYQHGHQEDICFLRIFMASGNVITCQSHNSHNGYYGGLNIEVFFDNMSN